MQENCYHTAYCYYFRCQFRTGQSKKELRNGPIRTHAYWIVEVFVNVLRVQ